jgi:hypothetical protein
MKLLINYANKLFRDSQQLNSRTGMVTAGFDKVISYGPRDIDRAFFNKNKEILSQAKGGGYWLWKSYFINKSLELLQDGDHLFYCDSGAYFVGSIQPLIDICTHTGKDVIVFNTKVTEKCYTKRDAFIILDCDTPEYTDSLQRMGGFVFLRKSKFARDFINAFLEHAQDKRLITDMDNVMGLPNYECFQDHRHDQSILSLISKKYKVEAFRDPSQFGNPVVDKYPNSKYSQLINLTRDQNASLYSQILNRLENWRKKIH